MPRGSAKNARPSDKLREESLQMEWNLHKLRNSLDRERAKAPSTQSRSGPIWQSASSKQGSLRAFASDVRGSAKKNAPSRKKGGSNGGSGGSSSPGAAATIKKRVLRGNECKEWSKSDVQKWLQSLGLAKYKSVFAENEIDGAVLLELGVDDLDYMEIHALAHRKTLLKEVARLQRCVDSGTKADGRPSSRQLQPLRSEPQTHGSSVEASTSESPRGGVDNGVSGGYQGGDLDEAAEHEAFKRAVEEWRSGVSASSSQARGSARTAKDAATENGAAAREIFIHSARENTMAESEGCVEGPAQSQNSLLVGELDEEAERRAFQDAVQQWRTSGDPSSKIDRVDYNEHKEGSRARNDERVQAMLQAYETNLKIKKIVVSGSGGKLSPPTSKLQQKPVKKNASALGRKEEKDEEEKRERVATLSGFNPSSIDLSAWDFDAAF